MGLSISETLPTEYKVNLKTKLKRTKIMVPGSNLFKHNPQCSKSPHLYGMSTFQKSAITSRPTVTGLDSPFY